jgi:hypothetical protein
MLIPDRSVHTRHLAFATARTAGESAHCLYIPAPWEGTQRNVSDWSRACSVPTLDDCCLQDTRGGGRTQCAHATYCSALHRRRTNLTAAANTPADGSALENTARGSPTCHGQCVHSVRVPPTGARAALFLRRAQHGEEDAHQVCSTRTLEDCPALGQLALLFLCSRQPDSSCGVLYPAGLTLSEPYEYRYEYLARAVATSAPASWQCAPTVHGRVRTVESPACRRPRHVGTSMRQIDSVTRAMDSSEIFRNR